MKWCWENWASKCKTMNLSLYLTPYTKLVKNNQDLNKTTELIEENTAVNLYNLGVGNGFLDENKSKTQENR